MLALDDAKALGAVAEERGHRDAAVLDLGVAEVADGLVVVERPEGHARAAERVPEAGREALGRALREVDELVARRVERRRARDRGGHEGRGGAEGEGEDDLLHVWLWLGLFLIKLWIGDLLNMAHHVALNF